MNILDNDNFSNHSSSSTIPPTNSEEYKQELEDLLSYLFKISLIEVCLGVAICFFSPAMLFWTFLVGFIAIVVGVNGVCHFRDYSSLLSNGCCCTTLAAVLSHTVTQPLLLAFSVGAVASAIVALLQRKEDEADGTDIALSVVGLVVAFLLVCVSLFGSKIIPRLRTLIEVHPEVGDPEVVLRHNQQQRTLMMNQLHRTASGSGGDNSNNDNNNATVIVVRSISSPHSPRAADGDDNDDGDDEENTPQQMMSPIAGRNFMFAAVTAASPFSSQNSGHYYSQPHLRQTSVHSPIAPVVGTVVEDTFTRPVTATVVGSNSNNNTANNNNASGNINNSSNSNSIAVNGVVASIPGMVVAEDATTSPPAAFPTPTQME